VARHEAGLETYILNIASFAQIFFQEKDIKYTILCYPKMAKPFQFWQKVLKIGKIATLLVRFNKKLKAYILFITKFIDTSPNLN